MNNVSLQEYLTKALGLPPGSKVEVMLVPIDSFPTLEHSSSLEGKNIRLIYDIPPTQQQKDEHAEINCAQEVYLNGTDGEAEIFPALLRTRSMLETRMIVAAQKARREGDVDRSLELSKELYSMDPMNPFAIRDYVETLQANGKDKEAEELLMVLDKILNDPFTRTAIGKMLFNQNKIAEAKVLFSELYKEHPQSHVIRVYLAKIAQKEGQLSDALNYVNQVLESYKYNNGARQVRHDILTTQIDNLEKTLKELVAVQESAPDDEEVRQGIHEVVKKLEQAKQVACDDKRILKNDEALIFTDPRQNLKNIAVSSVGFAASILASLPGDSTQCTHIPLAKVDIKFKEEEGLKGLFDKGQQQLADKNYPAALNIFKLLANMCEKQNQYEQALYKIAYTLELMEKYDELVEVLEELLSKNPKHAGVLELIGNIFYKNGDDEEALKYINASLKLNPKNARALFNRSQLYFHYDMGEGAVKDLIRCDKLNPNHPMTRQALDGIVKKFPELVEIKEEIKEQKQFSGFLQSVTNPSDTIHLSSKTKQLIEKIKTRLSENDFDRSYLLKYVQEASQKNHPDHFILEDVIDADFDRLSYESENALSKFKNILKKQPNSFYARVMYGNVLREMSYFNDAKSELEQALKMRPQDAYVLLSLAKIDFEMKKYDEALQKTEEIEKLHPQKGPELSAMTVLRSFIFEMRGDVDKAINDLEGIDLDSGDTKTICRYGVLKVKLGQYNEGFNILNEKVLQFDPQNLYAKIYQFFAMIQLGYDSVLWSDMAESLIQKSKNSPDAFAMRGLVRYKRGELELAYDDFERTTKLKDPFLIKQVEEARVKMFS